MIQIESYLLIFLDARDCQLSRKHITTLKRHYTALPHTFTTDILSSRISWLSTETIVKATAEVDREAGQDIQIAGVEMRETKTKEKMGYGIIISPT